MKKIFIILLLIPVPAIFYLLKPGFYEPHDLHHFADIYEMYRAFSSGQFPPRLGPDFLFGFGYPLFNFYYVMPFYLGSLFYFILGSIQTSFKLVFMLSAILSVFGMYLFLREIFSKRASIVGSILFLYTPYRAVQIYVRGAMGEALALSLAPFVFWILLKLLKKPDSKKLIFSSSFIIAIFILSHNYLWALILPFLSVLLITRIEKNKFKNSIFSLFCVGVLSVALTSFWWLPAIFEQRLVASTTPFPLIDHFPFIKQLIIPSWGYGSSVWGSDDEISFQLGVVNWLVFLTFIVSVLTIHPKEHKKIFTISIWAFLGFVFCLFLMNIRSYPLWKIIPFHDFIQFPWRLLILTTFFSSILASVVVEVVKKKSLFSFAIIFGSILFTLSYFKPSQIFFKSDDEYLARFFANRITSGETNDVSDAYINYSEDYLLLPKWVSKKINYLPGEKIESDDVEVKNIKEISPVGWQADISSVRGGKIFFNSYYFPGWFAKIDNLEIPLAVDQSNGRIEVKAEGGNHRIFFYWGETKLRKFADLISLMALIATFVAVSFLKLKKNKISE